MILRKYFGYTVVGWLNMIVLQWFFVRLEYGYYKSRTDLITSLRLRYFVMPLTGWRHCSYLYIGKWRSIKLWSRY